MKLGIISAMVLGMLMASPKLIASDYFFVHASDPQYGFFDKDVTWEREQARVDSLVAYVNRVLPPFVIFTGDYANQSTNNKQINAFKKAMEGIDPRVKVYLTPGNHDIGNKPDDKAYEAYLKNYGYTRFCFTHDGDLFIGIDSNPIKNGDTARESEQYEWLEKQLAEHSDARHKFVFMHHPLYIKKRDEEEKYSNLSNAARDKYIDLLNRYDVDVLLTGHHHNTTTGSAGKLKMYTAGAIGRPLGKGVSGVNLVAVSPDNIEVSYVPAWRLELCDTVPAYPSYKGLVMAGYQGWFNAADDGEKRGFYHYKGKNGRFEPGSTKVDMWPDITEYPVSYETAFKMPDGKPARVFSSADRSTTDLHFKWMKDYGLDGVFMQRFVVEIKNSSGRRHFNNVLNNAVNAANRNGRAIAIMYDLSGMKKTDVKYVLNDIDSLTRNGLFNPLLNNVYLQHNGKPLVAVWGTGFDDNRKYDLNDVEKIVDALVSQGFSVLLGVPTHWRELKGDTTSDPKLHKIIKKCAVVMPWFVGRYDQKSYKRYHELIKADKEWCQNAGVDYAPLVFPGFTWKNMKGPDTVAIDRNKGSFLNDQLDFCIGEAGAEMIYVAMFDEIDEGTAIFKCAEIVPVPSNGTQFVPIEKGLGSDHYLKIVGKAASQLKHKK